MNPAIESHVNDIRVETTLAIHIHMTSPCAKPKNFQASDKTASAGGKLVSI